MGDGVFPAYQCLGFFFDLWLGKEGYGSVNKLSLSLYHNTFITHLPFPVQPRFYNRISYHTRLGELPQYGIQSVITVQYTITINCHNTTSFTTAITFVQDRRTTRFHGASLGR